MNRTRIVFLSTAAAACLAVSGASTSLAAARPSAAHSATQVAGPASGSGTVPLNGPAVVVFSMEGTQLSARGTKLAIYKDPSGCHRVPLGAHVLDNLTAKTVRLYVGPFCAVPAPPPFNNLAPGYGAHISPTGSFKVVG